MFIKKKKGDEQLVGRVESFKNEFRRYALRRSKKVGRTEFRRHFVNISVQLEESEG
jgi:hypothetical protein